jgi:hypothetical protein
MIIPHPQKNETRLVGKIAYASLQGNTLRLRVSHHVSVAVLEGKQAEHGKTVFTLDLEDLTAVKAQADQELHYRGHRRDQPWISLVPAGKGNTVPTRRNVKSRHDRLVHFLRNIWPTL